MSSAGSRQGGPELADMACGLVEPHQFDASELYKYYHMSIRHVGERDGTFKLYCLLQKGLINSPQPVFVNLTLTPLHPFLLSH